LKPESKFWKEWKTFTPNISWTRLENMSSLGTPDLLGYNKNKTVKSLASSISKLYEGKNIKELSASGLQLDACCLGLEACRLHLEQLGSFRTNA
jgi:hypothetical protein